MSGICGIVRFDGQAVKKEEIQNMLDAMQNRGNDAEGIWVDGNVGFGHKMLWTTPESLHENQPLISKDSNLVITADARIDNRDELFKKLEINEKDFDVITDIDLILWSYQKWGEDCPKYLIGDFAFIIYDIKNKKFVCIRDHMGIKPFYYYVSKDKFIFASEIEPIFANFDIQKIPNIEGINNILSSSALDYDQTLFKNILRLPIAHSMVLHNKNVKLKRYWFPEKIKVNWNITLEQAGLKFYELLKKAVNVRLRSAYPVGCELSGGLDSSSITTIATEIKGSKHIKSFSLRYGKMSCDEGKYIEAVISQLGIDAHFVQADLLDYKNKYSIENQYKLRPEWFVHGVELEIPAEFELIQSTNVRVMLTGLGSDQVIGGDSVVLADYFANFQYVRLYSELKHYGFSKRVIKNKVILPLLPKNLINILRSILNKPNQGQDKNKIFFDTLFEDIEKDKHKMSHNQQISLGDIIGMHTAYMADRTTYQIGGHYDIEFRHPFFDKDLIEFSLTLPPYMKFSKGAGKIILREAMKGKLAKIVHERTDKGEYTPIIEHQSKATLFHKEEKMNCIKEFSVMTEDDLNSRYRKRPWPLLGLEYWLRYHFE